MADSKQAPDFIDHLLGAHQSGISGGYPDDIDFIFRIVRLLCRAQRNVNAIQVTSASVVKYPNNSELRSLCIEIFSNRIFLMEKTFCYFLSYAADLSGFFYVVRINESAFFDGDVFQEPVIGQTGSNQKGGSFLSISNNFHPLIPLGTDIFEVADVLFYCIEIFVFQSDGTPRLDS
jgi:hypothetical protein